MNLSVAVILIFAAFFVGMILGIYITKRKNKKFYESSVRKWVKLRQSYHDEQVAFLKEDIRLKNNISELNLDKERLLKNIIFYCDKIDDI